jgi:hypothetical protein
VSRGEVAEKGDHREEARSVYPEHTPRHAPTPVRPLDQVASIEAISAANREAASITLERGSELGAPREFMASRHRPREVALHPNAAANPVGVLLKNLRIEIATCARASSS